MPEAWGQELRAVCLCGSQSARHPPPFPQYLWIEQTAWESRDFRAESSVANTPELEGPQSSSASSLSIKQVHCTDPP